ncbi:sarcoplasmic calcium-binding protein-like isoform X2 [Ruditapes philippinarum]|uniref:sarcoplasmic calcium-binding protein-like isoform X2 n=1 Tax=Ruditapes philippinarum TaxID=129788 RepID=UPI00295C325F|nr:sarcoplasmic calcium-binding protein-like isoform X2 [Ruditapes philippinarum]
MQNMTFWTVLLLYALSYKACVVAIEQESSKANDFLIEKWGKWFYLDDFNQDGILSLDDIKMFAENYKARNELSDKQLKTIKQKMDRLWKTFYFTNKKEISKDDFINMMKQRYESNTAAFIEMVLVFSTIWCEVIDLNGDKFLSKDEFILNFVAQTHNNIRKDEQFFYTFQPINERVPNEDIIAYFVRFGTESNRSKSDVVLNAVDSGV